MVLTDELQSLECAVQTFLAGRLPVPDLPSARTTFFEALYGQGWSAPCWPLPWGGGLSPVEAVIVDRALNRAGAPVPDLLTIDVAGPLILELADTALHRHWLPGMARGAVRVCMHPSLMAGEVMTGRLEGGCFLAAQRTGRVPDARGAQAIMALATDGKTAALVLAPLQPALVRPGLPLEPDTVDLEGLAFHVVTAASSTIELRERVASVRSRGTGRSWTGRLRYLLNALTAAGESNLAALDVSLCGLEALEMRVLADPSGVDSEPLRILLEVRSAELGRKLVEKRLAGLGYYALAAPDPGLVHNELPGPALVARGAEAELIRYLLEDVTGRRNRLARLLGQGG